MLRYPLSVPHDNGRLEVLKQAESEQSRMGEALTLDGIVNSIDAELIAKGTSGKGPERGAIVRHGRYTLWAFEGGVEEMTDAGKSLFINTVYYAARHGDAPVLEQKRNGTRDDLLIYLRPGLIETMKNLYLPPEMANKSLTEVQTWLMENRLFLRTQGRRYEVDEFAKQVGIPNHQRALLKRCIANLSQQKDVKISHATLMRYTGQDLGESGDAWRKWYEENGEYLFFSDSEGFQFKVDEEAKRKKIPVEKLRDWSSECIDYR